MVHIHDIFVFSLWIYCRGKKAKLVKTYIMPPLTASSLRLPRQSSWQALDFSTNEKPNDSFGII